ncbi:MAG: HNH endonuclease [Gammaproteobacteria bacterium]|nr:HNH endonuclease [Gammaproteobacteria bacterium]
MQFWVGITDESWFKYLSSLEPDEVNFWQPGPTPPKKMDPGTLFLFKLHAPNNYIVGGGWFVRFTVLPCFLVWDAYGVKNGVTSLDELVSRMARYRGSRQTSSSQIGCNLLTEPFFFSEQDWIPIPENWSPNIQRGLTYDTEDQYGAGLWEAVRARLPSTTIDVTDQSEERYAAEYLTRARLGQGAFRILVTDAYRRRCAVTGEKTLPALDAAHIKPYKHEGPHRTSNGLLLRADIHRLFDDGYVTIDPELRFVVSNRVREEFENGREYYRFHGEPLQNLPTYIHEQPSRAFIDWHNQECFEKL